MIVANGATDGIGALRYNRNMSDAPRFRTKPTSSMNQWVRDAIQHHGKPMSVVADEMNKMGLKTKYDRSKIQKMTVGRRVTYEEAEALSKVTGFPLGNHNDVDHLIEGYQSLDKDSKKLVRDLVTQLRG